MSNRSSQSFHVRAIAPELTHVLRHTVLRQHQTLAEMVYSHDDDETTLHLGACRRDDEGEERVIGCLTLNISPMPHTPAEGDVQLRGMAVSNAAQGTGVGRALVEQAIREVAKRGGRRIWCNARVSALGFYQRLGFVTHGEIFEIVPIGPHYVMSVRVH